MISIFIVKIEGLKKRYSEEVSIPKFIVPGIITEKKFANKSWTDISFLSMPLLVKFYN